MITITTFDQLIELMKDYNMLEGEEAATIQGFDQQLLQDELSEIKDYRLLIDWMLGQGYEHIAMKVAYSMLREEAEMMEHFYYYPAQDYLMQLWCEESQCIIDKPARSNIEPPLYINTILTAIDKVESHLQEGIGMGLYIDQVILHDALFGRFMGYFDRQVQPVMRLVFGYMDMIAGCAIKEQDHLYQPFDEQSEEYRTKYNEHLTDFDEWIKEVCSTRLPEGMNRLDTLSEGYLKATAERVMWGSWREEDEAI